MPNDMPCLTARREGKYGCPQGTEGDIYRLTTHLSRGKSVNWSDISVIDMSYLLDEEEVFAYVSAHTTIRSGQYMVSPAAYLGVISKRR